MKTFLNTLLVSLMIWLGVSCSSNTPESVAEDFAESIYSGDYDHARELCTPESAEAIGLVQGLSAKYVEDIKKCNPDVKVLSCEMAEDEETATVKLEIKNAFSLKDKAVDPEPNSETYKMQKVDGKWRVHVSIK